MKIWGGVSFLVLTLIACQTGDARRSSTSSISSKQTISSNRGISPEEVIEQLREAHHDLSATKFVEATMAFNRGDLTSFRSVRSKHFCDLANVAEDLAVACNYLDTLDRPVALTNPSVSVVTYPISYKKLMTALGTKLIWADYDVEAAMTDSQCEGFGCYNVWNSQCRKQSEYVNQASRSCNGLACLTVILQAGQVEGDCTREPKRIERLPGVESFQQLAGLVDMVSKNALARIDTFLNSFRTCNSANSLPLRCLIPDQGDATFDEYLKVISNIEGTYEGILSLVPELKKAFQAERAALTASKNAVTAACQMKGEATMPPRRFFTANRCSSINLPTNEWNRIERNYSAGWANRQTFLSDALAVASKAPSCSGIFDDTDGVPSAQILSECASTFASVCAVPSKTDASGEFTRLAWRAFNRKAWSRSPEFVLATQACLANTDPIRANALVLEAASKWDEGKDYMNMSRCLDVCTLDTATRTRLDAMEGGRGYKARITIDLASVENRVSIFTAANFLHAESIRNAIEVLDSSIAKKGFSLGPAGEGYRARLQAVKQTFGQQLDVFARQHLTQKIAMLDELIVALDPETLDTTTALFVAIDAQFDQYRSLINAKELASLVRRMEKTRETWSTQAANVAQKKVETLIRECETAIKKMTLDSTESVRTTCNLAETYLTERKSLLQESSSIQKHVASIAGMIDKRLDMLRAIAERKEQAQEIRSELCTNLSRLSDFRREVIRQKKIDQASGTVNLTNRRSLAEVIIRLTDDRERGLLALRKLSEPFVAKRDCASQP